MAPFVLVIFTIILLSVERSSGQIKCCETENFSSCTEITCKTNQSVCLSVSSFTNLSTEQPSRGNSRKCAEPKNNLTGSFYFDFGNERFLGFSSEVCKTSACTAQYEDPPIRSFENGKYCPKCYRPGYNNCEEDGTVLCLGDLQNCTEVNGVISGHTTQIPFAAKGCASASVCKIKPDQSFFFGALTYSFKSIKCSEANSALASLRRLAFSLDRKDLGPQMTFFFPCILGIFAVKILS